MQIEISKEEVGFNLIELEQLAASAVSDNEVESVTDKLCDLNVEQSEVSDDEDETESDTTDSDDSTSSSSDDVDVGVLPKSEKNKIVEIIEKCDETPEALVSDLTEEEDTRVNP